MQASLLKDKLMNNFSLCIKNMFTWIICLIGFYCYRVVVTSRSEGPFMAVEGWRGE